ncbi:hypothetical protein LXA43DRAFT_493561 [Ganoderma leucocontextum]|nr:hypothetical protein LXA43DRAFT_493561 [Ganoderma leucocontextum]
MAASWKPSELACYLHGAGQPVSSMPRANLTLAILETHTVQHPHTDTSLGCTAFPTAHMIPDNLSVTHAHLCVPPQPAFTCTCGQVHQRPQSRFSRTALRFVGPRTLRPCSHRVYCGVGQIFTLASYHAVSAPIWGSFTRSFHTVRLLFGVHGPWQRAPRMARVATPRLLAGCTRRTVRSLSPPSSGRHDDHEYAIFHAFSRHNSLTHHTEEMSQHLQRPGSPIKSRFLSQRV